MNDSDESLTVIGYEMDFKTGVATLFRSDGKVATFPGIVEIVDNSSHLSRATHVLGLAGIGITTSLDDFIPIELPRQEDESPVGGRPVIYLDQNHWSTITRALYSPEKIANSQELAAAHRIIELAEKQDVVLPLSAGHVREIAKWQADDWRYRQGVTVLRLSRGWQLRDPLEVRNLELSQALSTSLGLDVGKGIADTVATLAAGAIFGGRLDLSPNVTELGESVDYSIRAMSAASAVAAVVLDEDAGESSAPNAWVERLEQFRAELAKSDEDKMVKRKRAYQFFNEDVSRELAAAAVALQVGEGPFVEFVKKDLDLALRGMPCLGTYREVYRDKCLDSQTRWESNDLNDLMYLTCAAGYVDYVVGDRRTIGSLRQVQPRSAIHARLAPNLRELITML